MGGLFYNKSFVRLGVVPLDQAGFVGLFYLVMNDKKKGHPALPAPVLVCGYPPL